MRIVIHPQRRAFPGFDFQAHLVLETNCHFRLIDHWKRTVVSGSSCIGQFSGVPESAMLDMMGQQRTQAFLKKRRPKRSFF